MRGKKGFSSNRFRFVLLYSINYMRDRLIKNFHGLEPS